MVSPVFKESIMEPSAKSSYWSSSRFITFPPSFLARSDRILLLFFVCFYDNCSHKTIFCKYTDLTLPSETFFLYQIAAVSGGQVNRYFGGIGQGGQIVERLFDSCFEFWKVDCYKIWFLGFWWMITDEWRTVCIYPLRASVKFNKREIMKQQFSNNKVRIALTGNGLYSISVSDR